MKNTTTQKVKAGAIFYMVHHGQGKYRDEELKLIGVFSSKKLAMQIVADLKTKPGFKEVGKFSIDRSIVDRYEWTKGFVKI
jgi:hypothetical protein